jgi:hypothetical protein
MDKPKSKNLLENVAKIMKLFARKLAKHDVKNSVELPSPQELLKKGFHFEDIEAAMRCLAAVGAHVMSHNPEGGPPIALENDSETPSNGVRHLHISESIRLSADAQQKLVTLLNQGVIAPAQLEKAMEYLWVHDLRDVSPIKLEVVLGMANQFQAPHQAFTLSDRVGRPHIVN